MRRLLLLTVVTPWLLAQAVWVAERNVVLVVSDDQSLDAGCYGNTVIQTPNLDALASDGTLFTHAFCTTASCSASRSVILTGLHNHANGHYGHQHDYHKFIAPTILEYAGAIDTTTGNVKEDFSSRIPPPVGGLLADQSLSRRTGPTVRCG